MDSISFLDLGVHLDCLAAEADVCGDGMELDFGWEEDVELLDLVVGDSHEFL